MDIKIFPSILSCDFRFLKNEIKKIEKSGADGIHIDIMDGHFVPNFSMGPKIVEAINKSTNLFLDVHLMMYNPFDYIERFIEMGADMISIHFEATENIEYLLKYIRRCGKKAGLVFNPETSESMVVNFLDKCDQILFMTVHPGFGGQKFMEKVLDKVEFTRNLCNSLRIKESGISKKSKNFDIAVDGGINRENSYRCIEMGANVIISGSYLFSFKDMKKGVEQLRKR
ncbi:MAG: ribulose phosphate epimerase [Chlamydiae bacterium SM23_39]|nr:MAG: ribulose phosphate epimerase [Chlamydiae bacterium SM23_39]